MCGVSAIILPLKFTLSILLYASLAPSSRLFAMGGWTQVVIRLLEVSINPSYVKFVPAWEKIMNFEALSGWLP
jgi:hypothetical protein